MKKNKISILKKEIEKNKFYLKILKKIQKKIV